MAINLNSSKFKIKIDTKDFGECTYFGGARLSVDAIVHRETDGRKGVITRAGDVSFSTVVVRKPFVVGDSTLIDWVQNVRKLGAEKNKKTIGIVVQDEEDSPKLEYTLTNAWPISYSISPLIKDGTQGSSRVIEEITLTLEDLEFKVL